MGVTFCQATRDYEAWLSRRLVILSRDLALKHARMREGKFPFLRATFYRWAQVWGEVCPDAASAPSVLAIGDLHVENFGTWRDGEGRLVWGTNDFDEMAWIPWTIDLVRLATSAVLAIEEEKMALDPDDASDAIVDGYCERLARGGEPFVLAESHGALRNMAVERLRDPKAFWEKMDALPSLPRGAVPVSVARMLSKALPQRGMPYRVAHRVAGLGSLGRQRFVAIADWEGGKVAREAKALASSACLWASGRGTSRILYQQALDRSVRCKDPHVRTVGSWIVRRLAPDCSRIELSELGKEREEIRLLEAMGAETANVHVGTHPARALLKDLRRRPRGWLRKAAERMADSVSRDWQEWRKGS